MNTNIHMTNNYLTLHGSVFYVLKFYFQVKNMIEHCLMLYKNKKQTVETLWKEAKIEPILTETGTSTENHACLT